MLIILSLSGVDRCVERLCKQLNAILIVTLQIGFVSAAVPKRCRYWIITVLYFQLDALDKSLSLQVMKRELFFVARTHVLCACQSQRFRRWSTARAQCILRKMNSW